jgi:hypothetical protein
MPQFQPQTALEFTPAALGAGSPWQGTETIPPVLVKCIDNDDRAVCYVHSSDETTTTISLPGLPMAIEIPTEAIGGPETLELFGPATDAAGHIVRFARPSEMADHLLVVEGVDDPAMKVQMWGPEIVAKLAEALQLQP